MCVSAAVIISSCSALDSSSQSEEESSSSQLSRQGRFLLNGPQTLNNYKLITKSDGTSALFYNAAPQAYVNYTDTQTEVRNFEAFPPCPYCVGTVDLMSQLTGSKVIFCVCSNVKKNNQIIPLQPFWE